MLNTDTVMFIVLFVGLAVACIGIGVYVLMKVGEPKNPLLAEVEDNKKNSHQDKSGTTKQGLEARLEENNELITSFNKTESIQTKLKTIQDPSEKPE